VLNVASTKRNQANIGSRASASSTSRTSTTIGMPMMCSTRVTPVDLEASMAGPR
jgi:hypothetical protein